MSTAAPAEVTANTLPLVPAGGLIADMDADDGISAEGWRRLDF